MKYLMIEDKTELISLLEILQNTKMNNKVHEDYRVRLSKIISGMLIHNYR